MPAAGTWIAAALCAWLVAGASAEAAECTQDIPPPGEISVYRQQFTRLINDERESNGLGALKENGLLELASFNYACLLAATDHFDHTGPDGTHPQDRATAAGYEWCVIAENLAYGRTGVIQVFRDWMNSEGHRENMMLPGVRELGLALIRQVVAPDSGAGGGLAAALSRYGAVAGAHASEADSHAPRRGKWYWVLMLGDRC